MALKSDRFSKALLVVAAGLAVVAIAFVALAFTRRPNNPVEAELVYEGLRIARGLPLYVDPSVGAWEDGGPPSRFFVLYTPFWPSIIGHLGGAHIDAIRTVGRGVATASWLFLFLAPIAATSRERRVTTATVAFAAIGIWFLARNAPSATPDMLAVALACAGLLRAARRGHFDALSGALLVLAPFVKPSCLGIVAGAAVAHLVVRRVPSRWLTIAAAGVAASLAVFACQLVSDGAWVSHLVRSTGQPLSWTRFAQEMGSRAIILGIPHVVVLIVAARRRASIVLIAPLAASLAWSSFSMAKHGSGTQYWVEPTMAAVVAVAFMPAPVARAASETSLRYSRILARCAAVASLAIVGATSAVAVADELGWWRSQTAAIAAVDRHCVREPGELVVSSDPTIELALDGRILVPDWQSAFLARVGKFPADAWRNDLRNPRVRWLALEVDPEEPLIGNDARVEVSAFRDVLRSVVEEEFVRDAVVAHFVVFRRRSRPVTEPGAGPIRREAGVESPPRAPR